MHRGRSIVAVVVVVCAATGTACASGGGAAGVTPLTASSTGSTTVPRSRTTLSPATSTSTTTSTLPVVPGVDPTLEKTVWDAYLAALNAIDEASVNPDPNNPILAQHLTNAQLAFWQKKLAEQAADGETANYPPATRHRARLYGISVKGANWVDLDVCSFDDAVVSVRATGAIVNDRVTIARSIETLWLEQGAWRLAGRNGREVGADECPGL